jgi:hypothetical protein
MLRARKAWLSQDSQMPKILMRIRMITTANYTNTHRAAQTPNGPYKRPVASPHLKLNA